MSSPGTLKDQILDIVKVIDATISSRIQDEISNGDVEIEALIQRVTQSGEIPPNELAQIVAGLVLEAFRAFKDNALKLLLHELDHGALHNWFLFCSLFSISSAIYTRTQLIELLAKYANNMNSQKEYILKRGLPKRPFRESLWLDGLLGSFYPVKELYLDDSNSNRTGHCYDAYGDDYFSNCVRARHETRNRFRSESNDHMFSWATPTSSDFDAESDVGFEDIENCRNLRPKLIDEIQDYRPKFFEMKLELLILLAHLLNEGDPNKMLSSPAHLIDYHMNADMERAFREYEKTNFTDYTVNSRFDAQFGGHFSSQPFQEIFRLVAYCAMEVRAGPSHNFRTAVNDFGLDAPMLSYFHATATGSGKKLEVAIEEYSRQTMQGAKSLKGDIPSFIVGSNLQNKLLRVVDLFEMALVKCISEPVGSASERRFDPVLFRHSPDYRSVKTSKANYSFTPGQAAIIRCMHKNRHYEVGQQHILEEADLRSRRVVDLFRTKGKSKFHPAWGEFVIPGEGPGTFCLNPSHFE